MYTTKHSTCNKNAPQVNVTVSNIPVDMSYWGTPEQSCVPSVIIEQVIYKNMYDYHDNVLEMHITLCMYSKMHCRRVFFLCIVITLTIYYNCNRYWVAAVSSQSIVTSVSSDGDGVRPIHSQCQAVLCLISH